MMRRETQFFACSDFGDRDDEERYKWYLTSGQVVALAAQVIAAVAAFRAAGALPRAEA